MPDEREKTLKELQEENLRATTEHLKAQTEYYTEQNQVSRTRKETRRQRHEEQERILADGRLRDARIQRACTHRKGGKGGDLAANHGNDPNFAIAIQGMPDGSRDVWCTRCFAHWKPGDVSCERCRGAQVILTNDGPKTCPACKGKAHPTNIPYETALNWPTDNTPSGSVIFRLPEQRAEEPSQELQPAR